MADFEVNPVVRRIQYTAAAAQTIFVYPFSIFVDGDLAVYLTPVGQQFNPPTDLLALNIDYTVTGAGDTTGGTVVLTTPATAGDIITIVSDLIIERQTDFETGGEFLAKSLDDELDRQTMFNQQNQTLVEQRGLLYAVNAPLTSGDTSLPFLASNTGVGIPIWTKNASGALVAALLEEGTDCSTLRSELASATVAAPGAGIVGFNDSVLGAITVDASLKAINTEIDTINTTIAGIPAFPGVITGLNMDNATLGDPDHDVKFNTGIASDSTKSVYLNLGLALTKQIDSIWAPGDNAGGLFSGSVAANTTYYAFIIEKDSDNSIDCGFDTSITAANIPAGYTKFARVGAFVTDGSSNIRHFHQNADEFSYDVGIEVLNLTNPGTAAVLQDMIIPTGFSGIDRLEVLCTVELADSAVAGLQHLLVTSPAQTDSVPSTALKTLFIDASFDGATTYFRSLTDSSAQLRFRTDVSVGTTILKAYTIGWIDKRGKV